MDDANGKALDLTKVNLGDSSTVIPVITFQASTGTTTASTITITLPDYYSFDSSIKPGSSSNFKIESVGDDTTTNANASRNKLVVTVPAPGDPANPPTVAMSFTAVLNKNTIDETRAAKERVGEWTPNGTTDIPATTGFSATTDNNNGATIGQAVTYVLKPYTGVAIGFNPVCDALQDTSYSRNIGTSMWINEHGKPSYRGLQNPSVWVNYVLPDPYTYGVTEVDATKGITLVAPEGFTWLDWTPLTSLKDDSQTKIKNVAGTASATISANKKTAVLTWTDDSADPALTRVIGSLHLVVDDQYWSQKNQDATTLIPSNKSFVVSNTVYMADGTSYAKNIAMTVYPYYGTIPETAMAGGIAGTGSYSGKVILQKVLPGVSHTTGDVTNYPSSTVTYTNDKRAPGDGSKLYVPASDGNPTTITATYDSRILATDATISGDSLASVSFQDNDLASVNFNHTMATRKLSSLTYYTTAHPEGITVDLSSVDVPDSFALSKYMTSALGTGEYLTKISATYSKFSYTSALITGLKYTTDANLANGSLLEIDYAMSTTPDGADPETSQDTNYILIDNSQCPTFWQGMQSGGNQNFVNGRYGDDSDGGEGFALKVTNDFLGDVKDGNGDVVKSTGVLTTLENPVFTMFPMSTNNRDIFDTSYFTNGKIYMHAVMGTGWTATVTTISAAELKASATATATAGAHTYTVTSPTGNTGAYTWDLYKTGNIPSDQVIVGIVLSKEGSFDISALSNAWDGSAKGVAADKTLFSLGIDNRATNPLTGLYYGYTRTVSGGGVTGTSILQGSAYAPTTAAISEGFFHIKYDNCVDVDARHAKTVTGYPAGYPIGSSNGAFMKGAELIIPSKVTTTWSGVPKQDTTTTIEGDVALTGTCFGDAAKLYSVGGETFYLKLTSQQYATFVPGSAKVDGVTDPNATIVTIGTASYLKVTNASAEKVEKTVTSGSSGNGQVASFSPWKVTFDVYSQPSTPTNAQLKLIDTGSWLDLAQSDPFTYTSGDTTYRVAIQSDHTDRYSLQSNSWARTVGANNNIKDDPLGIYASTAANDLNWAIPVSAYSVTPNANAEQGVIMLPGIDNSYQPSVQPVKSYQEGDLTTGITVSSGIAADLTDLNSTIKIPRVGDTLTSDPTLTSSANLYLTGPVTVKADVLNTESTTPVITYSVDGGNNFLTLDEIKAEIAAGTITGWDAVTHIHLNVKTLKKADAATLSMPMRTQAYGDGTDPVGTGTAAAYMEAVYTATGITATSNRTNTFTFGPDTVSGTVWNDSNHDGMMDGSETKAEGVTVKLYGNYGAANQVLVDTQTTGVDGAYSFSTKYYKNLAVEIELPSGTKTTIYSDTTDNKFAGGKSTASSSLRGIDATLTASVSKIDAGIFIPRSVAYDGNGNTSGAAPAVKTDYAINGTVTVLGNTGASAETAAPYVRTGYTFTGWNTKADGTGTAYKADDTFVITADTTLYAQWDKSVYTVKFATQTGGSLSGGDDQKVAYQDKAKDDCTVVALSGDYVFQGWKYECTDDAGTSHDGFILASTTGVPDKGYTTFAILGDTTFTAMFAKKPYVTSNATGGLTAVAVSTDVAVPATAPAASSATSDNAGVDEVTPLPASAGITYKPADENHMTTPAVKVTDINNNSLALKVGVNSFKPGDATEAVTITLAIDETTKVATITTSGNINDSLSFYAEYPVAKTTYTVNHYVQKADGSWPTDPTDTVTSGKVDAGSALPAVSTLTKDYGVASFDESMTKFADSAHTTPQVGALPAKADGSTVLSLYYGLSTLTVTFDANGHGTAPKDQSVLYGATATEPASLTAAGYVFGGWYTSKDTQDDTTKYDFATAVTKDITLYAKWTEAAAVTLAYVSADTAEGTVDPASESVAPATGIAKGSKATPAAGYHFVNWTYDNADGEAVEVGTDPVLSTSRVNSVAKASGIYVPVTFTANFAEDDVTIKYVSADTTMGAVDPASETVSAATGAATGSTATASEGYTFVSWTDGAGKVVSTDPAFVPAKVNGLNVAATYTANFVAKGKVSVVKSVDVASAKPGDTVTYTLTLTNTGTATSDHVWVKDYVPANTSFVSCDALGAYASAADGRGYVTWYVDPIEPEAQVTLTLAVKLGESPDGTIVSNVASYKPTSTKPDPATDPTANGSTTTNTVTSTVSNPIAPAAATPIAPAASTPSTGDTSLATGVVGTLALACVGLAAIAFGLRRKRREER